MIPESASVFSHSAELSLRVLLRLAPCTVSLLDLFISKRRELTFSFSEELFTSRLVSVILLLMVRVVDDDLLGSQRLLERTRVSTLASYYCQQACCGSNSPSRECQKGGAASG